MARNILGTYAAGVTITNAGDNPLRHFRWGEAFANSAGIGLQSALPVYWSVTNAAGANISGNSFGVSLANAGIFTTAAASHHRTRWVRLLLQHGDAGFRILSAALFMGGGQVANNAGGRVVGGGEEEELALGGTGTVFNAGSIRAPGAMTGFGVALAVGGSVTNASGGLISASDFGVFADGAIAVSNQANATIYGASRGIFAFNGQALVSNQGTVSGGYEGVLVSGGWARSKSGPDPKSDHRVLADLLDGRRDAVWGRFAQQRLERGDFEHIGMALWCTARRDT